MMQKILSLITSLLFIILMLTSCTQETIELNHTFWVNVDDPYSGFIFWDNEYIEWSAPCAKNQNYAVLGVPTGGMDYIIERNRIVPQPEKNNNHSTFIKYKVSDDKLTLSFYVDNKKAITYNLTQIYVNSLSEYYSQQGIELIRQGSPEYVANTTPSEWF